VAGGRGREGKKKPAAEPRHFTRDPIILTSGKIKTAKIALKSAG